MAGAATAAPASQPTADHQAEALVVRDWIRTVEEDGSEYIANLKRLAEVDDISSRNTAMLGSAVASYWRAHNERVAREARKVSQFIGQVKERLTLALTVRADTPIEGDWGVSHLYILTDCDGNVFKWFSGRGQDWEIGQEVRIKGTVKCHETYMDVHQTQLTRCAAA